MMKGADIIEKAFCSAHNKPTKIGERSANYGPHSYALMMSLRKHYVEHTIIGLGTHQSLSGCSNRVVDNEQRLRSH